MSENSALYEKLKGAFDLSLASAEKGYLFQQIKRPLLIFVVCVLVIIFSTYKILSLFRTYSSPTRDNTFLSRTFAQSSQTVVNQNYIYVDISGAVLKPQTYKVSSGSRLFELLNMAGGLSLEADRPFIQRNYNLAIILTDQQKIHFPTIFETKDGYFTENRRVVTLNNPGIGIPVEGAVDNSEYTDSKISINNASQAQLETLPGIGPVTAQRIIAGRPFSDLEELVNQEILKDSLYQQILQQLTL